MMGHDHALTGAVAFTAIAPLIHPGPAGLAAGIVFTAGAALLPDLDEPGSTLSRESGLITITLAHVVRKLSGGHRCLTHSAAGVTLFAAASWGALLLPDHVRAPWWLHLAALAVPWFFLQALLAAALHALRLGCRSADPVAAAAATFALWQHWGMHLAPLCIAIGACAHIAGDMLTHHGCPVAYPFSRRDYGLLPEGMRITTGKFAEHWVVSPLLVPGWRRQSAPGVPSGMTANSDPVELQSRFAQVRTPRRPQFPSAAIRSVPLCAVARPRCLRPAGHPRPAGPAGPGRRPRQRRHSGAGERAPETGPGRHAARRSRPGGVT